MKDYIIQNSNSFSSGKNAFLNGLVFGFDVGTGSIGYAVRRGSTFLDVGVLICDSEGSDLSKRRDLRRSRRTLRSKKFRRQWFAKELIKLGLLKPEKILNDPISLRIRALNGDALKPEELHAALTHLFKRRGYSKVPWANEEMAAKEIPKIKKDDDVGIIEGKVKEVAEELAGKHPCQLLASRRMEAGKSPMKEWARKIYWPREVLRDEFLAIAKAQNKNFSELAEKANWLLYGDSHPKEKNGQTFHVFFKSIKARNPGVLGLRWPRFDNRGPALDSLQPVDDEGRPLHVVRKNKPAFTSAQWELALMNFRVLDFKTRQKIDPRIHFPIFIENLRNEWNKKKNGISLKRLGQLAIPFADKFLLVENQKALTPETGTGRARYSSPTLNLIRKEIDAGRRVDPPQPILRRKGENAEQALNRYLADVKHPLVRHRLVLFRRLLAQFVSKHGQPDMIVLEAVRSLALGQKAKNELNKRNEKFRKEREVAREQLSSNSESFSRKAIQRYRLWQEAKGRCPFCLQTIERTDLGHGADVEHLVPRSVVDCNEFYNLTVAHIKCNRELKGNDTPLAAFGGTSQWEGIKTNAENCFSGRKLEIFLSPNAEELIEQKSDLQHTAYIARVIRHISLIQLGWISDEGRDPTPEKQNPALSFQVTNGQLTSRLRKAWGLNQILHPIPPCKRWDELTDEEQNQFTEKNRGDLRHHSLDAMVISCTLPWLAHRTVRAKNPKTGEDGWWDLDERTQRSVARNPIFPNEGQMHEVVKSQIEKVVVRHHVSQSTHHQAYATTLYAKKAKDTYVAREVFTSLTPKNLGNIWPETFALYCKTAWSRYSEESTDIEGELKRTKGSVPFGYTSKLCFAHFQKWRADECPEFYWPKEIKIPIRNVRLISLKDDSAVVPFSPGTHAFVKRTGFKEVQIFLAEDEKSFVPVFIPYWKNDKPLCVRPIKENTKPIATIRRGGVVTLKKLSGPKNPIGNYRVVSTMQAKINLVPTHIQDKPEALLASGFLANGVNISWQTFFNAVGYELPHPPSVKPQSESPNQA
jgi:hypothetical protein